jgi:hypothetical protein
MPILFKPVATDSLSNLLEIRLIWGYYSVAGPLLFLDSDAVRELIDYFLMHYSNISCSSGIASYDPYIEILE